MESGNKEWRPFADPTVPTLWSMAILVIGFAALLTGHAPLSAAPIMVAWAGAMVLTLSIAAIILYRNGNFLVATPLLVFGAIVGTGVALTYVMEVWPVLAGLAPYEDAILLGWIWMAIGIIIVMLAFGLGRISGFLFVAVMIAGAAGIIYSLVLMGHGGVVLLRIDGWLWFIYGLCLMYAGLAFWINGAWGKPVFPVGAPIFK